MYLLIIEGIFRNAATTATKRKMTTKPHTQKPQQKNCVLQCGYDNNCIAVFCFYIKVLIQFAKK